MYSALNYAVVNRHLIAFAIREAFREVFGPKCEFRTLYDLMHNYAWEESHAKEGSVFVHRKGQRVRCLPGTRIIRNLIWLQVILRLFQDRWGQPRISW